jgi:hypothetical protein
VTRVREELLERAITDPDFRSIAGRAELQLYEALAAGTLAAACEALSEVWTGLHDRVPSERKWKSVYDTAHLVLSKYIERATGRERETARGMLAMLAKLAGVVSPASPVKRKAARRSDRKRPLGSKRRRRS